MYHIDVNQAELLFFDISLGTCHTYRYVFRMRNLHNLFISRRIRGTSYVENLITKSKCYYGFCGDLPTSGQIFVIDQNLQY